MARGTLLISCAVAAALLTHAGTGHAEPRYTTKLDDPYFAAKLLLGFGGSASAAVSNGTVSVSRDSSLGVSFGLGAQYVVPLHEYFSLGGTLDFLSWQSAAGSDSDGGRNLLFDLAVLPEGKYAIDRQLELYLAVPIGLSLDFLNEANSNNGLIRTPLGSTGLISYDAGAGVGLIIGFLLGARYQLTDSVGLLAELGYIHRNFSHTVKANLGAVVGANVSAESDVSVSLGQFGLNLGAYF
jgi:hypothetical protein